MVRSPNQQNVNVERMQQRVLGRLCKILAGDYGVDVRFSHGIPHTDGKTVVLNPRSHQDFILNRIMQEAIAAHEAAGHVRFTDFKAWQEMIQRVQHGELDAIMKDLVNCVEDARVNYLLSKEFKGSGQMLKVTQKITYNQFKDSIKDGTIGQQHLAPQLIALASECICRLPSPFIGVEGFDAIEEFMQEVRPVLKKVISQRDTQGVVEACESILLPIYRKHYPLTPKQEMDEQMASQSDENPFTDDDHSEDTIDDRAKGKQKGKDKVDESEFDEMEMPDGGAGDGESGEGEESESDEANDGDGEGEDGEGEDGEGSSFESESSESESSESSESSEGESSEGESSEGESESSESSDGGDGESSDEQSESADESDEGESSEGSSGDGASDIRQALKEAGLDDEMIDEMEQMIEDLSEQMDEEVREEQIVSERESKQIKDDFEGKADGTMHYHRRIGSQAGVKARDYDGRVRKHKNVISTVQSRLKKWVSANKAGKVSRKHRVGFLDERRIVFSDDSDKVYRRKQNAKKSKVAVSIVIDESGSMDGQRKHLAAEFACVLSEVFNGLGWHFEVLGFDYNPRSMKGFNDALNHITKENIAVPYANGNTNAKDAIKVSTERQERFGYTHRMGIMVMDGQPNDRYRCKQAIEDSSVEWLGIGIDGADVSHLFPTSISCNAAELVNHLSTIKEFCKKAL